MHTINFYDKIPNKKQAAFVLIYSLDGRPWLEYNEDFPNDKNTIIPTCLAINRWDSLIGLPGGFVEDEKSLEETVIKETFEEINFAINTPLEPLIAHDTGTVTTHLFVLEVPYSSFVHIQKNAINSSHFGNEITGVFSVHLTDYADISIKKGGIVNLLKSPLVTSFREELVHFLLKKNIFTQEKLIKYYKEAGFDLKKLLA